MLIPEIFATAARCHPDRPALWHRNDWHSFGELESETNRVAHVLSDLGVQRGERVALLAENSFFYAAAHFGILKSGAVDVSLNVELKGESLAQLLAHSDAVALIVSEPLAQRWIRFFDGANLLRHILVDTDRLPDSLDRTHARTHPLRTLLARAPISPPVPKSAADTDLASIVYTSGSTGQPKGVMLSHRNLVSNTRSIVEYLALRPDDRMLVVLPFHYIYGRSLLYTHLASGGAVILDNRFAFPAKILDTMVEQAVTCFAGVPSTFSILLHKTDLRQRKFPSLRLVTQAGGGMPPAVQQEVAEAFAPARLFVMYGSTEAAPRLTYVDPTELPRKWGSIGKAIPNVEVAVLDERGERLPPGIIGQIAARGPNIMMGYWKDPDGTARVLQRGFYLSGDLGYVDEEGFIFLTGRSQDMIKTGGNRVSAKEVEDALAAIAGVVEAAVLPVPDELMGELIKAVVVVQPGGPDERALTHELNRKLPSFKVPKFFEYRDALPKNANGKVDKAALRAGAPSAPVDGGQ